MRTRLVVGTLAAIGAAGISGCAAGADAEGEDSGDGAISIVASTDVYGDIAARIGGVRVQVTSIIDSPTQDPHSYEASARDRLAVERADLVVINGGGYDPFLGQILEAGDVTPVVLDAVEVSGLAEGAESLNEHVWYDLEAMSQLGAALASELEVLDPDAGDAYATAAADFTAELEPTVEALAEIAAARGGEAVVATEPVPGYLLDAAGLKNVTPEAFSEAIEEGDDVPPRSLDDVIGVISDGTAALLAYNSQTASTETEQVRTIAEKAGLPIVEFAETLPEGAGYPDWMADNVDRLQQALER